MERPKKSTLMITGHTASESNGSGARDIVVVKSG